MTTEKGPEPADTSCAFEPLFDALRQGRELLLLTRLSVRGVHLLQERYDRLRQLAEASDHFYVAEQPLRQFALTQAPNLFDPDKLQKELETLRETAESAKAEIERDFAGLNNRAWVDLWGLLEDTIRLFLVNWLANRPEARRAATRKMKVNLDEYDELDEEEKLHFIAERLFRETGGRGAARFENLLKPFGLSGPVDKQHEPYVGDGKVVGRSQELLEGQCLRNALVHRRGIIDRKSVEDCPSLAHRLGERTFCPIWGMPPPAPWTTRWDSCRLHRLVSN